MFIAILFAVIYFLTRIVNLTILPIFTDEASYLYASSQVANNFAKNWDQTLSLPVAKPPIFFWLTALAEKLGVDGILAPRLIAVLSGMLLLLAIYLLTEKLIGKKEAVIASFLYLISPFNLFYDRIGLMENLLVALLIFCLFFLLKALEEGEFRNAILAGVFLALAILTKQSGQIGYLLVLAFAFIFLINQKISLKNLKPSIPPTITVVASGFLLSSFLRFSPKFEEFNNFTTTYLNNWPIDDLTITLRNTLTNISAVGSWLKSWLTTPVFLLSVLATLVVIIVHRKRSAYLLSILILPIIIQTTIRGPELFPRYFLIVTPAVLAILSVLLLWVWRYLLDKNSLPRIVGFLIIFALFVPSLIFDFWIISDPIKAPFHYNERWQYISNWPSGYGILEATNFIKKNKVFEGKKILVDGHNGHLKDSLQIYGLSKSHLSYVTVFDFEEIVKSANYDFIIANRSLDFSITGYEKLISFPKPYEETAIAIFSKKPVPF